MFRQRHSVTVGIVCLALTTLGCDSSAPPSTEGAGSAGAQASAGTTTQPDSTAGTTAITSPTDDVALANPGSAETAGTQEDAASGTGGSTGNSAGDLPCEVAQVLQDHCWKCHGTETNWGAPMSLADTADFAAQGTLTPAEQVGTLVQQRMHDASRPMPPTTEAPMPEADRAVLESWLAEGSPAASTTDCELSNPTAETPADTADRWAGFDTSWPDGVAPEETCYRFMKHGAQSADDSSPHIAAAGETYVNFFYKVPWTEPVVATRWRTIYDQTQILHHWLLYRSAQAPERDGQWEVGTGAHPGAELLAVWAVGGGDEDFPPGVGLRMPPPGSLLEVEWHLYNPGGSTVADNSGIEVCVVPEAAVDPQYVAGVAWLGTEDLILDPGSEVKRGGVCTPSFAQGGPIHIIKWMPHMHLLGTRMSTWLLKSDGSDELVFDEPFLFDSQIMYNQIPPVVVAQGDRLHTQCTYQNTTPNAVLFGESTTEEMCYQFAFAYPVGSLASNFFTWNGSNNTCLSANTVR